MSVVVGGGCDDRKWILLLPQAKDDGRGDQRRGRCGGGNKQMGHRIPIKRF